MAIAYVDDVSEQQIRSVHREIVTRIIDGTDVQEYLDSLGYPIVVYYASDHYKLLAPTFKQISGKKVTLRVDYVETGHNARCESREVNETAFFTLTEGYFRLFGDLGLEEYPRRNDLAKVEAIGDGYVDVRLPFFFDEYGIASHFHETDAPHRIDFDNPLEITQQRIFTAHKYKWNSTITITLVEID